MNFYASTLILSADVEGVEMSSVKQKTFIRISCACGSQIENDIPVNAREWQRIHVNHRNRIKINTNYAHLTNNTRRRWEKRKKKEKKRKRPTFNAMQAFFCFDYYEQFIRMHECVCFIFSTYGAFEIDHAIYGKIGARSWYKTLLYTNIFETDKG